MNIWRNADRQTDPFVEIQADKKCLIKEQNKKGKWTRHNKQQLRLYRKPCCVDTYSVRKTGG